MKPFRILSLILLVLVVFEVWAILRMPMCEKELGDAWRFYSEALKESVILLNQLGR